MFLLNITTLSADFAAKTFANIAPMGTLPKIGKTQKRNKKSHSEIGMAFYFY
ncbi:MAG: hypothetical protein ACJATA_001168 [Sphingobacteriales bacterium]|jgi:hypothetical protein